MAMSYVDLCQTGGWPLHFAASHQQNKNLILIMRITPESFYGL